LPGAGALAGRETEQLLAPEESGGQVRGICLPRARIRGQPARRLGRPQSRLSGAGGVPGQFRRIPFQRVLSLG
jgi:hypothetical protein